MSKNPWGDSTSHTRRPNTSASRIFDATEYTELEPDAEFTDSAHANTSPFASSSPSPPHPNSRPILDHEFLSENDSEDETYGGNTPHVHQRSRAPRQSLEEKVLRVLELIKTVDPRLSLRLFLVTLFDSDTPELKKIANLFHSEDGSQTLLDIWSKRMPEPRRESLNRWALSRAAAVCERSASLLTDEASTGPFKLQADFLRMPASTGVSVQRFRDFSMEKLGSVLESTMEPLQVILKAVIGKEGEGQASGQRVRNPKHARIFVTSILLNLRSRNTNLLRVADI
ncbi:hypothetical protein FRC00_003624 [Tulasnella sp. 408]|nr:hypothetical protein FRC00_003624 [Tulasnella sp. 408]